MAKNYKSSSDDREKRARYYSPTKSITNPLVILPGGVAICVEPTVIPIAVESAVKSKPGTGESSSSSESKSSSNKQSQQQHEERIAVDKRLLQQITSREASNPWAGISKTAMAPEVPESLESIRGVSLSEEGPSIEFAGEEEKSDSVLCNRSDLGSGAIIEDERGSVEDAVRHQREADNRRLEAASAAMAGRTGATSSTRRSSTPRPPQRDRRSAA